jgi:hypothetical protein
VRRPPCCSCCYLSFATMFRAWSLSKSEPESCIACSARARRKQRRDRSRGERALNSFVSIEASESHPRERRDCGEGRREALNDGKEAGLDAPLATPLSHYQPFFVEFFSFVWLTTFSFTPSGSERRSLFLPSDSIEFHFFLNAL